MKRCRILELSIMNHENKSFKQFLMWIIIAPARLTETFFVSPCLSRARYYNSHQNLLKVVKNISSFVPRGKVFKSTVKIAVLLCLCNVFWKYFKLTESEDRIMKSHRPRRWENRALKNRKSFAFVVDSFFQQKFKRFGVQVRLIENRWEIISTKTRSRYNTEFDLHRRSKSKIFTFLYRAYPRNRVADVKNSKAVLSEINWSK